MSVFGSTVKETRWTSDFSKGRCNSLIRLLINGQGPRQLVKTKSAIQIFPFSWAEPNGWSSWFTSWKDGTWPNEPSER